MKPFITIQQATASYPVFVAPGLLDSVGKAIEPRGRVFVITSTVLRPRFGDRVAASFAPPADTITIEEGEQHKTMETANAVVTQLLDSVVRKAIKVKAAIVSADEKEADLRRLLNYGHTVAHGIEAALQYQTLTHGEAVGWGMIAANAIAARRGILSDAVRRRIDDAVRDWKPSALPPLNANDVIAATEHDQKNTGTKRIMVFPREIGRCEVVSGISDEELRYGLEAIGIGG